MPLVIPIYFYCFIWEHMVYRHTGDPLLGMIALHYSAAARRARVQA